MRFYIRKKSQGLTLLELLISMIIVTILALIGVPGYGAFMANERFAVTSNELYNAYRFARNEAIKTSSSMTLEAIDNQWLNGWQVKDKDGLVLRISKKPHLSITVSGASVTVGGMGSLSGGAAQFSISSAQRTNYLCVYSSGQSKMQSEVCL